MLAMKIVTNRYINDKEPAMQRVFFGIKFIATLLIAPLVLCPPITLAGERLPRLELGVGIGTQFLNDYRGSTEHEVNSVPFPFVIYRGDIFKMDDEDGVRGEFLKSNRFELNVSADIELRSNADDNKLRQGMPELDTAVQLGPEFNINLSGKNFRQGWMLRLPVRGVFTINSDKMKHIGYTFNPKLSYRKPDIYKGWRFKADLGLLYGTQDFHRYYYEVPVVFANVNRPAYQAEGGFSGVYSKFGMSRRKGRWIYQIALRYDSLNKAVFSDSPLVDTNDYFALSVGIGWVIHQSK